MDESLQLVGALLAGALGAGAIFRFFAEKAIEAGFTKALHRENLLTETDLEFRRRQLEEFYGPIYASLKLSAQIYPLWIEGRFEEINTDVIALFKKQNEEVISILKTKAHLINGGTFPPAFTRYMTSVTIWGMYCSRPAEPWLPPHVAQIAEVGWPEEFEKYIYAETEELKQELDALLKRHRAT